MSDDRLRILDTDTCIELLRGNARVIEQRARSSAPVATTWMTAAELHLGAASSAAPEHNARIVDAFLATIDVLGMDAAAARLFGEAKALLRRRGRSPTDADLLIAAVTVAHGAVVVTGNRAHFARVPGVAVEDWIRGERPKRS